MKNIAILGSTGSIGTQTLDIVRLNKDFNITVLTANQNIELLANQIIEFTPEMVCVYDENKAVQLKEKLNNLISQRSLSKKPIILAGMDGLVEAASYQNSDIVVTAVVGMIGIRPTIAAIKSGKDIALANKETLVCAGHIIMKLAVDYGVKILPVDSEHSAIFQSLQGKASNSINKIILTASGGPFLHFSTEELKNVTLEDALKHPNWSMGAKVTIDSSTMINKGLEVCEAMWLFDTPVENIEVVIQPQSIIHSAVEYLDGSIIAQLGVPDMRLPISYALTYPERRFVSDKYLDLFEIAKLDFIKPDLDKFKGLKLARIAAKEGGSLPTIFNAANEAAVSLFLQKKIEYLEIVDIIEKCLNKHKKIDNPDVSEIECIGSDIFNEVKSYYKE